MHSNQLALVSNTTIPISSTKLYAFIEVLCKHAFIVRVGPKAVGYGKLWEAQVTGHIIRWWQFWHWRLDRDWFCKSYVVFKGFAGGKLETEELETMVPLAVETVNRMYSLPVRWKRLNKSRPYWLLQISGLKEGEKVIMKMKRTKAERKPGRKMPHTDEAVREDGTLDPHALEAAGAEVLASFKSGEYTPLSHTVVDLGAVKPGLEVYQLYRQKN